MDPQIDKFSDYWLEQEVRRLEMPDGSRRNFRCMRIHWGCYDALVENFGYSPERLMELTVESAAHEKRDIDTHFPEAMAFLEEQLCRVNGVPYRSSLKS